jgi:integrase
MSSDDSVQTVVEKLLKVLPDQVQDEHGHTHAVSKRTRRIVREILMDAPLSFNRKDHLVGLTDDVWEEIFNAFIYRQDAKKRRKHRNTQYHWSRILRAIAEVWVNQGWMDRLPRFTISQQHPRQLSIRDDRMWQYPHSDYVAFSKAFISEVNGMRPSKWGLVPEDLRDAFPAYLGLGLILSGFCRTNPVAQLCDLHWEDLPDNPDWPIQMPNACRNGYRFFWLPSTAHVLLAAARYRTGQSAPAGPVFLLDNTALRTQITDLVERICQDYDLPVPTLRQLCDRIQNHLLDDLDNLPLSVVLSRVPYRPVGLRQAVHVTQEKENEIRLDDLPSGEVRAEADTDAAPIEEASHEDHEAMMAVYDQLLNEIDDDLQALFEMKRPKKRIEALEAWIADHEKDDTLPTHNLIWLLRYVISLVGDRKKSPHTRGVYWYALRRVWATFWDKRLEEITAEDLQALIDGTDLDPGSVRQSLSQWCELGVFLRLQGLQMPVIDRDQLPVPSQQKTVRILTANEVQALIDHLTEPHLRLAVFLAARLGLRVSEICRLMACDFHLGHRPVLYISRSKGGKHRRVTLEGLTEHEMKRLQAIVESKQPGEHLVVDGDGQLLDPRRVSEAVRHALDENIKEGGDVDISARFHSLRGYGLMNERKRTGDIRHASSMAGHSLTQTTVASYSSDIDLEAVKRLKGWDSPLNQPDLHLPIAVVGALIGRTSKRVAQMVEEYNEVNPEEKIGTVSGIHLPDGIRPPRPGRPVAYLRFRDAFRLMTGYSPTTLSICC